MVATVAAGADGQDEFFQIARERPDQGDTVSRSGSGTRDVSGLRGKDRPSRRRCCPKQKGSCLRQAGLAALGMPTKDNPSREVRLRAAFYLRQSEDG